MTNNNPVKTDNTKSMIISKTPLRITFVGGGTDLPAYYKRYGPGAVTNCAIDKYIYVIIHKNFDNLIRVSYSKIEKVDDVNKIEHPTVREALKLLGIKGGVDITSMADVPAVVGGLGLGSSYSFLVGVLNALHAWKGELASPKQLAEEATTIELDMLKGSSGKQDQYIAAFGGLRFFEFDKNGETVVKPLIMDQEAKKEFRDHLLLLHTGREHHTEQILKKQSDVVKDHVEAYNRMRDYAYEMYDIIAEGKWHDVGKMMHENWLLKKIAQLRHKRSVDRRTVRKGYEGRRDRRQADRRRWWWLLYVLRRSGEPQEDNRRASGTEAGAVRFRGFGKQDNKP